MTSSKTMTEPAREVQVLAEYDVVVCGGGPAGCAAAVGAARLGAKTLLLEKDGYLGGATISQLVVVILSTNGADFQGVWHELMGRLKEKEGVRFANRTWVAGKGNPGYWGSVDPELVKFVWDDLVSEAGAEILHHAYATSAILVDGEARGVFVETKAGRRAVLAKRIIDTTGDGIICAQSGVPWEQGDGANKWAMSCTKVFRIAGVKWRDDWPTEEGMRKLTEDLREAVERGEYSAPVLKEQKRLLNYLRGKHWQLPGRRNEMMSVLSRVLRVDPLDPFDLTRAEREGREQARQAADFCCRYAPGFEEAYLLDTSAHLGVRSSRRIRGAETVTTEDAVRLKRYTDGIARCSFHIDVWPADSYERKPGAEDCADAFTITGFPREERNKMIMEGGYFDIRYGALVASGIDNLMMAGRCISADHFAESSLRIQQTCMATGEAAGVSAALSIRHETTPRELDPGIVVEQLGASRGAVEPAFDELRGI